MDRSLIVHLLTSLLISAPSLTAFFVVDCVCLSVTNITSFLFLNGIEPFLGYQFSMTKTSLQNVVLRFFLFRPPNAQNLLQNVHKIAYKSVSH